MLSGTNGDADAFALEHAFRGGQYDPLGRFATGGLLL
jgi:hypothetical protein